MTDRECVERIQSFTPEQLLLLWNWIFRRPLLTSDGLEDVITEPEEYRGWPPGKAFEYLVLRLFEVEGADVVWPFSVREASGMEIEQIDGVIYADGLYCLVESKDFTEPEKANFEPIAKLRTQLSRRPGFVLGLMFSKSGFTDQAKQLARRTSPQTILMWEGQEIDDIVNERYPGGGMRGALREKLRAVVEKAEPAHSIIINRTGTR